MLKKLVLNICGLLLTAAVLNAQQNNFTKLTGPYLGQKPPGKTPEPFAIGIPEIHTRLHDVILFSSDGKELFMKTMDPRGKILSSKLAGGKWSKLDVASFAAKKEMDLSPSFSPDGKKLYFIAMSDSGDSAKSNELILWKTERTPDGWSEPKPMPEILNSMKTFHYQVSEDNQGNLYFGIDTRQNNKSEMYIYCSKYMDGNYTKPEKLDEAINSGTYTMAPCISPDGSYLIFSKLMPERVYNIFISFKKKDSSWTEARNIKDILGSDTTPIGRVSLDGKYFFFLRGFLPYWVDASFIEDLRKEALKEDP